MAVVIFNKASFAWISLKILESKNGVKIMGSRNEPLVDATRSLASFEFWSALNYRWSLRYASMNV